MPDVLPLTGLTVVVTRPQQQGAPLADALRSAGASVIEYPVLEIVPLDATMPPATLARAAAVIFVSVNAVEHGLPSLRAAGTLSAGCLMMAIGGATATALHDAGIERVVSPQQNIDSEGLLALPHRRCRANYHPGVIARWRPYPDRAHTDRTAPR
jgi:uroporphyrinogen-III synthase